MKVAAYVRVSTQRQAQTQTIEQQLELITAHCRAQGLELAPESLFQDDGYSGASFKRPGLERLRDLVVQEAFERILITAPDRLARNYVHQMLLLEELQRFGCQVEFLERPMSQDPHDQLLLQIRGAVAEYERTLISERMRRGRMAKLKAGTMLPWTTPVYGYRLSPDRPRDPQGLAIDEAQAAVVKEIYARYLQDGVSLYALARDLHRRQIKSPTGQEWWHLASLHNLLSNPAYMGEVYGARTRVQRSRQRVSALRPVGKQPVTSRPAPRENWVLVCQVPPIVTPEQFAQVQEKLRQNQKWSSRNNTARQYLLRALVSCGHCRLAAFARGGKSSYSYYVCNGRNAAVLSHRERCCQSRFIPATALDELVWDDLVEVLKHPEAIARAMERARSGAWLPQHLQTRRERLARGQKDLQTKQERWTVAYLNGVIELEEYRRRREEIEAQARALGNQLQEIDQQSAQQAELAGYAAGVTDFARRVASTIEQVTFEQKRQLVELLIDRVIVTDDQVEIRYVIPTSQAGEMFRFCQLRSDYRKPL
jgi:site-specific DNA recombinase